MSIKILFGKKLREIRVSKALTQEMVAEKIGIQPENYSRIENGLSFPKPENIEKLSEILQVEISELFQFQSHNNYDEMLNSVIEKLKSDQETTVWIYKFLKSIGKLG